MKAVLTVKFTALSSFNKRIKNKQVNDLTHGLRKRRDQHQK